MISTKEANYAINFTTDVGNSSKICHKSSCLGFSFHILPSLRTELPEY